MHDDTDPLTPQRRAIGSTAPAVPYLSPRDSSDRGPGGSLIQARARERALRIMERPTWARDWRVWVAGVLAVTALTTAGVAAHRLAAAQLSGAFLLLLAAAAAVGAVAAVVARYRISPFEADLTQQIRRETQAARQLDSLRGLGWTVLHDRLVPGTEHRVAHLLAGPAGIVVATVLPVAGPVRHHGEALMTGDVPLTEWFAARWWEAERINAAVAERLADWPWTGPIYPLVLFPEDKPAWSQRRRRRSARTATPEAPAFPLAYASIAIRATDRARSWITAMPAPLGRLPAAQLAVEVEGLCPPAGVRD